MVVPTYLRSDVEGTLQERNIAYNAFLSSLEKHELNALLAHTMGNGESLEMQLHDMFERGEIEEDTIGAWILQLLGELP